MKIRYLVGIVLIIVVGVIYSRSTDTYIPEFFEVAVLDVGQGDAILITDTTGYQLLIDGGPDESVIKSLEEYMSIFDTTINAILLTHPDKDHVGGLVPVLDKYSVETIIDNNVPKETQIAIQFRNKSKSEIGAQIINAYQGDKITFPSGVILQILHPNALYESAEINNYSITARIDYGDASILMTGDIDSTVEMNLMKTLQPELLEADVLKIPHHGSKFSSAITFLRFVDPKFAVASYKCDNSYGHPHEEAVKRYDFVHIPVYTTCDRGTIVLQSDGTDFWIKGEK